MRTMLAGLLLLCVAAACARSPQTGDPSHRTEAADTLRGIIRVVGPEPGTRIELEPAGGGRVPLAGRRDGLAQLAALEVAVRGTRRADGAFEVSAFAVRAAQGIPAVDGTLLREGERYLLLTDQGDRLPIALLPRALSDQVGRRVWLAGPLDRAPELFGVIR